MTSERYLKFLAIMNSILFGFACLWCVIRLNFEKTSMIWLVKLGLLVLVFLVIFFLYYIPRQKGINPYKRTNNNMMKNSILFWIKDERELMMALKTYASGYTYCSNFIFALLLLLFIFITLDLSRVVILNSILLFLFFEMLFLNVRFVIDWNKYSNE